jgi:hypothetical protein
MNTASEMSIYMMTNLLETFELDDISKILNKISKKKLEDIKDLSSYVYNVKMENDNE